jgi:hypothetical protein
MELNKHHREALMSELEKAKKDKFSESNCKSQNKQYLSEDLEYWCDISIFLANERIKLIEQSIIQNEIDY